MTTPLVAEFLFQQMYPDQPSLWFILTPILSALGSFVGVGLFLGALRQRVKAVEDWKKDHMDTAHGWIDGKLSELVMADKELVGVDNEQWQKLSEHGESLAFLKAKVLNGSARNP